MSSNSTNVPYTSMANIRTLKDYRDEEVAYAAPQQQSQAFPNAWQQSNTYVASSSHQGAQQQQAMMQNQPDDMFWSYNLEEGQQPGLHHILLSACCPCFVGNPCSPARRTDYKNMLLSFIFWIGIVQIIYFIVEVSIGGFAPPAQNPVLGPGSPTLILLGAKYTYLIKYYGHVHRLIVPIIMHGGFIHIALNLYVQFMIGLGYEKHWRTWRMVLIYVISGIGGNLLSACAKPDTISVGASSSIMGLIGAKLANIISRWPKIPTHMKIMHIISLGIVILFTFLTSISPYVDWSAHLGGLLVGFLMGMLVFCNEWEKIPVRIIIGSIFALLTFAYYLITILMIYLVVVPPQLG